MNDRVRELQKQIFEENQKMERCSHSWGEPFYNPATEKVGYGSVQDGAGSDPHWSYAGYEDKKVDQWTRKCTKCGKEENTRKQTPVVSRYEPDFGRS